MVTAMKKIFFTLFCAAALLSSCSKQAAEGAVSGSGEAARPEEKPLVKYDSDFTVQSDESPADGKADLSKVYFDASNENALKWTADDEIFISNGSSSKHYYVKTGGSTHAPLYFTEGEDLSGSSFYAVFPAEGAAWSGGTYTVVIPTEQTCVSGGFDPAAFPMVGACGAVKALQFKNAGAVLAVRPMSSLGSSSKITSLTLSANEALAGECAVTWDGSGTPAVTCTGSTAVTLDCGDGVDWGTTLYVCVAPGTYTDFCVEVAYTGSTGQAHYTWRSDLAVSRSTIKRLTVDFTDVVEYTDLTTLHPVSRTAMDAQTANCYLITDNTSRKYRFPVTVKGNGVPTQYCEDNDYPVKISPKDIKEVYVYYRTGLGACLTAGTIFSEEPELIGDYICFRTLSIEAGTPSTPGSSWTATATDAGTALIAVSANPDWSLGEGMNALWSWMIWYNPVANDHWIAGDSSTRWLNMYLGAKATGYNTSGTMSLGYYYQWGRKDPFQPGNAALSAPFVSRDSDASGTLAKATGDPQVFYGGTTVADWARGEGTVYNDWWNANQTTAGTTGLAVAKTMFDPCPAGYHVMSDSALEKLLTASVQYASGSSFAVGTGWSMNFPGSGSRRPDATSFTSMADCWTALARISDSNPSAQTLYAPTATSGDQKPTTPPVQTSFYRSFGLPVRCEKE